MVTDEQLIADLTASLRQAREHLFSDGEQPLDGDEVERVLEAAGERLARVEPAPPGLLLPISVAQAERFSSGMADLLCWARGFMAARPDDSGSQPMGVNRTRDLRLALIDAIAEARGAPQSGELPF
jgi:hypothetical protein